jgi:hypothetical protein
MLSRHFPAKAAVEHTTERPVTAHVWEPPAATAATPPPSEDTRTYGDSEANAIYTLTIAVTRVACLTT